MRILTVGNMYPPHHLGGYEIDWHSWVNHARGRGHDVHVLTTTHREDPPDPDFSEDPSISRTLPWYWHDHLFPRLGPRAALRLEREAQSALAEHLDPPPQVVAWWAMGGMPLSLVEAVRRAGIPCVFIVMDDWTLYAPVVDRWQRTMGRLVFRRLSERLGIPIAAPLGEGEWIFLSEFTRKRAARAGLTAGRTRVLHPGIDPDRFAFAEPPPWRGELLCISRIDDRKGQDVAVRALTRLPGYRLRIVGGGDESYAARLKALVAELGVGDRVEFSRASRGEVRDVYAAADVVLFPVQWDEPWGLVPLEAMSVGRPVVASGTGGSAEYLRNGENSLVYKPREDPDALAAAIYRLEIEPRLRERIRAEGVETAASFTEAAYNESITGLIERLGRPR